MSCYHHLTIEERESILAGRSQGKGVRAIAKELGRSPSTISRELKRNTGSKKRYSPSKAQTWYHKRRKKCHRKYLLEQPELQGLVRWMLVHLWFSPEQISNRLRMEGYPVPLSTSTIYRGLRNGCLSATIRHQLRRSKEMGKYKTSGKSRSLRSIHDRPKAAEDRSEPGHLEGDTMLLRGQKAVLITVIDRSSRMLYTALANGRDVRSVQTAMRSLLSSISPHLRKTLTLDRGSEFALVPELEKELGFTCYFCDPASPRQRATNENCNGLLRQFFPKNSITFSPVSDLSRFTALLNLRPRKCLGWLTPFEFLNQHLLHFT